LNRKILLGTLITVFLISIAAASDVLYVKGPCFATPSEEVMSYLYMIYKQGDKDAFAKAIAMGVKSGEIVIWPAGKKLFLVTKVSETQYIVRPEGDPQCYHVVSHFLRR